MLSKVSLETEYLQKTCGLWFRRTLEKDILIKWLMIYMELSQIKDWIILPIMKTSLNDD